MEERVEKMEERFGPPKKFGMALKIAKLQCMRFPSSSSLSLYSSLHIPSLPFAASILLHDLPIFLPLLFLPHH